MLEVASERLTERERECLKHFRQAREGGLSFAEYCRTSGLKASEWHAVRHGILRSQRPTTACKHTVSGTISLPSPGCFSPFPHGTCSLSVASEYLALEDGPPSFPRGCTCLAVLGNCLQRDDRLRLPDYHRLWWAFPGTFGWSVVC